jgi:phosphohistidine phosphatase
MEIQLLRHGKAAPHGHPEGDFARELVEKGRDQARRAARFLAAADCLPELVLTSPVLRARQTAGIFCETAGLEAPLLQPWLACGMRPEVAAAELAGFREFARVMIVGHEPDFSSLVEWLLGAQGGGVEVKKATLAGLRWFPPARVGSLVYLVPPSMFPAKI